MPAVVAFTPSALRLSGVAGRLGLYRLATQMGRELPQINRVRIALIRSGRSSILGAGRNIRELHSHRRGDRVAECDRLTIGDRGKEGDCAAGRNPRRSTDD